MTFLTWIASIFGTVMVVALVGMAWILATTRLHPRDLRDDEIWNPEDWP